MTNEEIEKACELCAQKGDTCKGCPYESDDIPCLQQLPADCLVYINRLKDEIAGLTGAVEALKTDNTNLTRTLEECNEELQTANSNTQSAIQSFVKMETLYKVKCNELKIAEEKLQANLEKAYEHNEDECKRCITKVEAEQSLLLDETEKRVRQETAKELLQELFDEAMRYGKTTDGIEWMAKKYGVEVKE